MSGMVSVIIPAFNRQDYITQCLQSVLVQSYENFEIIIIDDGSTDQTLEICKTMAQTEPRIKLYHGTHQGVSAARNIGLDVAQGEYVFFVDSDDMIHPRLLETLVAGMKSSDAAMGGTAGRNIPQSQWEYASEKVRSAVKPGETEYYSFEDALQKMLTEETPFSVMGGVIMRRDWIADTRYRTDLSIGEDFYFSYQNLIKGTGVVFLKQKWYFNRIHDTNTSWDYGYTGFMSRFLRRELVWQSEEQFGRTENADRQKNEVLAIYLNCVKRVGAGSQDGKKMRAVLRQYRKVLLPAMKLKGKIAYIAAVNIPFAAKVLNRFRK